MGQWLQSRTVAGNKFARLEITCEQELTIENEFNVPSHVGRTHRLFNETLGLPSIMQARHRLFT